jgi:hypothetical protein
VTGVALAAVVVCAAVVICAVVVVAAVVVTGGGTSGAGVSVPSGGSA